MLSLGLPTCNRCKKRKKKCDNRLPDCLSCQESGIDCIFYDSGADREVPRRYVAALQHRVATLREKVAELQSKSLSRLNEPSIAIANASNHPIVLDLPSLTEPLGPPSYPHTDLLPGGQVTPFKPDQNFEEIVVSMVLNTANRWSEITGRAINQPVPATTADVCINLNSSPDKSSIEHGTVRELIVNYYLPIIHPQCPVLHPKQLLLDTHLRNLPPHKKLTAVLAAAIAAAHRARHQPELFQVATSLRHWAEHLSQDIAMKKDWGALQALMMLILYEMVEPSRRLVTSLLSTACRLCVLLVQNFDASGSVDLTRYPIENSVVANDEGYDEERLYTMNFRRCLVTHLMIWDRIICATLDREALMSNASVPGSLLQHFTLPECGSSQAACLLPQLAEHLSKLRMNICPLSEECIRFITENVGNESILPPRMYPVIVSHECEECRERRQGVDKLAHHIRLNAINYINLILELQRDGRIICIWLTTTHVFNAGLVLVDQVFREGIASYEQQPADGNILLSMRHSLIVCSRVLSSFAEIWPPGKGYRDIFDWFCDVALGE